jgi:hypothetical protein
MYEMCAIYESRNILECPDAPVKAKKRGTTSKYITPRRLRRALHWT